jgi:signal transduction histidine kinase/AmiR/NasT family two-component response regulator
MMTVAARLRALSSRLGDVCFGEPFEAPSPNVTSPLQSDLSIKLQRGLFLTAAACLVGLFVFATYFYASTLQRVRDDTRVTNISTSTALGRLAFGESPRCGDHECWTDPAFDDSAWLAISLPLHPDRNIQTLPGYAQGRAANAIYYRMRLTIPDSLMQSAEPISVALLYLQHRSYTVFLNARPVAAGGDAALVANVLIPKSEIHDGAVSLTIKASVAEEDVGLVARSPMLLGPSNLLHAVHAHTERAAGTYYLLFMLTKGTIFVVFSMFFAFTRSQNGLVQFLMFALFDTASYLFYGEFLRSYLSYPARVVSYFECKVAAEAMLLGYFLNFYGAGRLVGRKALAVTALVLVGLAPFAAGIWTSKGLTLGLLFGVTNALLVGVILFGLGTGALAAWHLRCHGAAVATIRRLDRFTIVLLMYLCLIIWEFYFNTYVGFDRRPLFDLTLFIWLAVSTATRMGLQEDQITQLEEHVARISRQAAIGETAQMIAHDVRKPFSMLKIGLSLFRSKQDPQDIRKIADSLLPNVERAMASVTAMLADITEASTNSVPTVIPVSAEQLIETALSEVFTALRDTELNLSYELSHTGDLLVDNFKVSRAFANLLDNAASAAGSGGRIWIKTTDAQLASGADGVRFVFGNSGKTIASADLRRIFEPFFTKGKRGGTGLGLAVVQRVIAAHQGSIRCESSIERGTEFILTLPKAPAGSLINATRPLLPSSSKSFSLNPLSVAAPDPSSSVRDQLAVAEAAFRRRGANPLRVLLVDDEPLYEAALADLINQTHSLAALVHLESASDPEAGLDRARASTPDLVILDVDFERGAKDGYELARELRARGSTAYICIHSNRNLPHDYQQAIAAGADAFLPKPMSQAHLLRYIAEAVYRSLDGKASTS